MDMMTSGTVPADRPVLDNHTAYQLFRDRVVSEDRVINDRVTWLLLSQTLALALFAGAANCGLHLAGVTAGVVGTHIALWSIATFGFLMAAGSGVSVRAAEHEIDHLCSLYAMRFPSAASDPNLPRIVGHRSYHLLGHALPRALPWAMCLLWLVLVHLDPGTASSGH